MPGNVLKPAGQPLRGRVERRRRKRIARRATGFLRPCGRIFQEICNPQPSSTNVQSEFNATAQSTASPARGALANERREQRNQRQHMADVFRAHKRIFKAEFYILGKQRHSRRQSQKGVGNAHIPAARRQARFAATVPAHESAPTASAKSENANQRGMPLCFLFMPAL